MPARPERKTRPSPGVGQGHRPSISLGGLGGALGGAVGSVGAGADSDAATTAATMGGDQSGMDAPNPSTIGGGSAMPTYQVMAKPNFLQMLDPITRQAYYSGQNMLANTSLENQGRLGVTGLENQGRLDVTKEGGNQARLTGSAATDNAIREATANHTLAMADKYGISPDKLSDFQNDTYNMVKQTAMSNAGTSANVAGARQNATGTPQYQRSQNIGMNAEAQIPAGQLAQLTKQEAGPGQSSTMFSDMAKAPFLLEGPRSTSDSTTETKLGPANKDYPLGQPMGGGVTTKGQTFTGGMMSQPTNIGDSSTGDAYSDYLAATGGSPQGQSAPVVNGNSTSPVNTKPAPVVQPQQPGMLSTLLDALKPYLQQNGGTTNPVTTRYGGY